MTLKPLTDLAIQKLPTPSSGQKVYYEPSGLGVRISQGGTKSFVVQLGARRRRKTLGRYPQLSLKAARAKAMMYINHADRYAVSYKSDLLIEEFLQEVKNRLKPRTHADYKRILEKHFPKTDIQTVDRSYLRNVMKRFTHRPGELFHITAVFKTFLNWCVQQDYIEFNPIAGLRNTGRVNSRERVLDDQELSSIWHSLPDDDFGTYVRLMILTGQRKGEIPYIEIADDVAHIDGTYTKNSRSHSFPVGALTLLYYQPVTWQGWSKSKARLDEDAGVSSWTYHDLRRTFATNHARLGTPIHVIEKLLNHVSGTISGVAAVYNRYGYMDEMRQACDKYEKWLASTCS